MSKDPGQKSVYTSVLLINLQTSNTNAAVNKLCKPLIESVYQSRCCLLQILKTALVIWDNSNQPNSTITQTLTEKKKDSHIYLLSERRNITSKTITRTQAAITQTATMAFREPLPPVSTDFSGELECGSDPVGWVVTPGTETLASWRSSLQEYETNVFWNYA